MYKRQVRGLALLFSSSLTSDSDCNLFDVVISWLVELDCLIVVRVRLFCNCFAKDQYHCLLRLLPLSRPQ